MSLEIVKFSADHIMDLTDVTKVTAHNAVLVEKNSGPAYSALLDGRCIGAGGALHIHGKVFSVWLHATPELKARKIAFHKLIKKMFTDFMAGANWQRIECLCTAAKPENIRWAKALGFVPGLEVEAKAGPLGEDMLRLAIVRHDET